MRRSTIRRVVNQPTSQIIKSIIEKHKVSHNSTLALYNRWDQEGLAIQKRTMSDPKKPNNKLPHDYRGYIVRQVVGYLFGNPLSYQIKELKYKEAELKPYKEKLSDFNILNAIDDLDNETGKMISICGYAARLLYTDEEANERVMNLPPWEVVFIRNRNTTTHAMRYYKVTVFEGAEEKERTKVEWYDETKVSFFFENADGDFVPDPDEPEAEKVHNFNFVPVILFQNNDEEKGDFENVEPEIDAYDKLRSDSVNEIETFANAYMKFINTTVDKAVIEAAKQTGAFSVDEGGDVGFITKNINDTFVENTRKTLNEDIHKFSASVDMTDEKFSGSSQSGESRKWKLIDPENKAGTKSRKFGKGLREQFRVLCTAWEKKGIKVNYLDIAWTFKRNIPIDLLYVSQYASSMKGVHSNRTLLKQIPYIENEDDELQLMEEEKEDAVDLDNLPVPNQDQGKDDPKSKETASESGQQSSGEEKKETPCPKCGGSGKQASEVTGKSIICKKCRGTGQEG